MGLGGNQQKSLKKIIILVMSLFIFLPFQNCGLDNQAQNLSNGLYNGDDDQDSTNDDCLSVAVDCGAKSEYLQISIDMQNPLELSAATNVVTVSGRCNTGNFAEHYIRWTLTNSNGDTISQRNEASICVRGKYQFNMNISGIATGVSHTVKAEIIGLVDGQSIRNYQAGGSAESDFSKKVPE